MPLSWNEIKSRAMKFSRDWANEASEDAEAKSFWDAFFDVFGITRKRVASFDKRIKTLDGKDGYIDLLWKGILLVEHKSRGKSLSRAYKQAIGYFPGIKERDLPGYILVSDFARFHLYDLETEEQHEFNLPDLYKHVRLIAPQFVKPYVKSSKNDANDAEAICEAACRPTMRFVAIKMEEQQAGQALHRVRSRQVGARTALVNELRGLLAEFGIISTTHGGRLVGEALEDGDNGLPGAFRSLLAQLSEELQQLDAHVATGSTDPAAVRRG